MGGALVATPLYILNENMKKVKLLLIVALSIILSSCIKETAIEETDIEKQSDYFPDILGQKRYKHARLNVSNHNTWFYTSGIVTWNYSSRFVRNDTTITIVNYSILDTLYYNNSCTTENGSFEIYEDKDHFLSFNKMRPVGVSKWNKYPRYVTNGIETVQYESLIFKKNIGLIHIGENIGAPPSYDVLDLIE